MVPHSLSLSADGGWCWMAVVDSDDDSSLHLVTAAEQLKRAKVELSSLCDAIITGMRLLCEVHAIVELLMAVH